MILFLKSKSRKLYVSIISILLISLLAAYWKKNTEWSRDNLSVWKNRRIETAWEEKWNTPNFELTDNVYYGSCRGCVILFCGGLLPSITELTVANERFIYSNVFSIWVYKNGEFITLEDAYAKGWLTDENIADIAEYHRQRTYSQEK
jgi:hypothetical protein